MLRIFFRLRNAPSRGDVFTVNFPLCALSGAIFLLWADVACRVLIEGTELPIGILTSMIGAPCFICLMMRKKYGFGGRDG